MFYSTDRWYALCSIWHYAKIFWSAIDPLEHALRNFTQKTKNVGPHTPLNSTPATTMMSSGEELDTQMGSGHSNRRRRLYMYGGIGTVVLIIVIVVAVVVSGGGGGGGGSGGSTEPGSSVTDPGTSVNGAIRDMIRNALLADDVPSAEAWLDGNSYQSKALNWVASNSQGQEDDVILQRYALACFYYATNAIDTIYSPNPPGWTDSTDWLSDKPECEWLGVQCSLFQVTGLSLPGNGLTGKIPMEMVLLKGTLLNLDLSENALYMSGNELEVFGTLRKLHTILLDDNYLLTDNGLPPSLAMNTNLEKLRLSYNLLGGPMQGSVVEKWTKLTHLEIESNFLDGALPAELGNLDKLVYMYMRRNDFTSTLDFMKSGRMNNMCELPLVVGRPES